MAEKRWHRFAQNTVSAETKRPGVYLLRDRSKRVLYIGHGSVRELLITHLEGGSNPIPEAETYYYKKAYNFTRAEEAAKKLMEWYKEKHGDAPLYNGGSLPKAAPRLEESIEEDVEEINDKEKE